MASNASSRRHLLRDLPQTYLVLGCVAVAVILVILLFNLWSPLALHRESIARPPASEFAPLLNESDFDKHSAGSIITHVPNRIDCWKRIFDNRTGYLWDNGYMKCPDGFEPMQDDGSRIYGIGKAFRHE